MANGRTVADLRLEYETEGIDFSTLAPEPVAQFEVWFDVARGAGVHQANAMVLSTADPTGLVSGRAVLLKGFDQDGFVFYTNLKSAKAAHMESNDRAALTFLWLELHRQVRIEGTVSHVGDEESDVYFASRPRGAQLAASVSHQSSVIHDRESLIDAMEELDERSGDGDVPRPDHWGGIRLRPNVVEFWQGRLHRLHDRALYTKIDGGWRIERLAP